MRTVYYAAVSADGFIADATGGVGWLEPFQSPELGYEAFLAGVGAVVLGRATYEQALTFGAWPYPGRQGLVVTSRPIANLPAGVRAVTAAELAAAMPRVDGDTWIVGGGRTARACVDAGLVDELELYVIPRVLGAGIPLLPGGAVALELVATRTFGSGIAMLRYRVAR